MRVPTVGTARPSRGHLEVGPEVPRPPDLAAARGRHPQREPVSRYGHGPAHGLGGSERGGALRADVGRAAARRSGRDGPPDAQPSRPVGVRGRGRTGEVRTEVALPHRPRQSTETEDESSSGAPYPRARPRRRTGGRSDASRFTPPSALSWIMGPISRSEKGCSHAPGKEVQPSSRRASTITPTRQGLPLVSEGRPAQSATRTGGSNHGQWRPDNPATSDKPLRWFESGHLP